VPKEPSTTLRITTWRSAAWRTIVFAGTIAGAMDITAAFLHAGARGATPVRVLQAVASGVLGPESFTSGAGAAALGLGLHFLIAHIWAAIYYAASRRFAFLTARPMLAGALYGLLVNTLMREVVVPLSAAPRFAGQTPLHVAIGYGIHVVCVGLPIALIVARLRRSAG